jgi:hypothetical protein
MSSLYELTEDWQLVWDMDELDSETWYDTLEAIEAEWENKADGYAQMFTLLDAQEAAIEKEEKRLAALKRTVRNKRTRLKDGLFEAMIKTGKRKFETALHKFRIQKNAKSVKVTDEAALEAAKDYWTPQPDKLDRKAVLEDLKAGKEVPGAELQQTESLRIA